MISRNREAKPDRKDITMNNICKVSGKTFRYNRERCVVEYVEKATPDMLNDNAEWQKKFGRDLWEITDGYTVLDTVGLRPENWNSKEARTEYLTGWAMELDEESAYLTAAAIKEFT